MLWSLWRLGVSTCLTDAITSLPIKQNHELRFALTLLKSISLNVSRSHSICINYLSKFHAINDHSSRMETALVSGGPLSCMMSHRGKGTLARFELCQMEIYRTYVSECIRPSVKITKKQGSEECHCMFTTRHEAEMTSCRYETKTLYAWIANISCRYFQLPGTSSKGNHHLISPYETTALASSQVVRIAMFIKKTWSIILLIYFGW